MTNRTSDGRICVTRGVNLGEINRNHQESIKTLKTVKSKTSAKNTWKVTVKNRSRPLSAKEKSFSWGHASTLFFSFLGHEWEIADADWLSLCQGWVMDDLRRWPFPWGRSYPEKKLRREKKWESSEMNHVTGEKLVLIEKNTFSKICSNFTFQNDFRQKVFNHLGSEQFLILLTTVNYHY